MFTPRRAAPLLIPPREHTTPNLRPCASKAMHLAMAVGVFTVTPACDDDPEAGGSEGSNWSPGADSAGVGTDECHVFKGLNGEALPPSVVRVYFQLSDCNGQPIAGKTLNDFEIVEDGAPLSLVEATAIVDSNSRAFSLETLLLIDMSGSVRMQIDQVISAATTFVQSVDPETAIAIMTFDGREAPTALSEFSLDRAQLQASIESLRDYEPVDNSTNLNGAFLHGLQLLDARAIAAEGSGQLYAGSLAIFTDGKDQAGRISDNQAKATASLSKHNVYTIGLSSAELDQRHLSSLATPGGAVIADAVAELSSKFAEIGHTITTMANSYYVLAYCSPKRGGQHEVKVVSRGTHDGFVFSFDAGNFGGLCGAADLVSQTE